MVQIRNCSVENLFKIKRKIYSFGVSKTLYTYKKTRLPDYDISKITYKFVDNNIEKTGTRVCIHGNEREVISVEQLKAEVSKDDIILVTALKGELEIVNQLDSIVEFNGVECYLLSFILDYFDSTIDENLYCSSLGNEYFIPAKIHYCWFGGKELPLQYKKNISNWEKLCYNYEIVEWNEQNYDIFKHPYMKWAYDNKRWDYLSDYARLDIIYNNGGIYLDTDVELLKNLDELRKFHSYIGFESTQMVNTGLGFGGEIHNSMIKMLLDRYDHIDYTEKDIKNLPCTYYQSFELRQQGVALENSFQNMEDSKMVVLPSEFLCGERLYTSSMQITKNTFSIHRFSKENNLTLEQIQIKRSKDKQIEKLKQRLISGEELDIKSYGS